jgi:hypothetical protein
MFIWFVLGDIVAGNALKATLKILFSLLGECNGHELRLQNALSQSKKLL